MTQSILPRARRRRERRSSKSRCRLIKSRSRLRVLSRKNNFLTSKVTIKLSWYSVNPLQSRICRNPVSHLKLRIHRKSWKNCYWINLLKNKRLQVLLRMIFKSIYNLLVYRLKFLKIQKLRLKTLMNNQTRTMTRQLKRRNLTRKRKDSELRRRREI